MYCRVLACDFDGTGATNGQLAPELAAVLSAARTRGYVTMLVTGRVHEDVEGLCADLSMFDAVVAENGAVVCLPGAQRTIRLGAPPPQQLLGELQARGVPFQAGSIIIGTWDRHAGDVLQLVRRFAMDFQLVFNRSAMMLLPSGVNKAVGVRRALDELGRSEHNLIAFGDAENDLPLFAMAGVAVAARGAVPAVAEQADEHLSQPGGAGVAQYVHRVLEQDGLVPTSRRHAIVLGRATDGAPVLLPGSGHNVMITGDPRSGKSWLAGLVAEQLLDRGYHVCVIDPEGDYLSLAERPRVLGLGHDLPLPEPHLLPRVLRWERLSLILNLVALSHGQQNSYVEAVLSALLQSSKETGVPQWIMIDEAHYFFHHSDLDPASFRGYLNFLFVTYRPSLVASHVFNAVTAHLVTHTTVEEERYFMTGLLASRGPRGLVVVDALAELHPPLAGLLIEEQTPLWQVFTPGERLTAHAHHGRKYVDVLLPEDAAFHFLFVDGEAVVARNVAQFHRALKRVPITSLRHHLTHGDFSRWTKEVLGDEQLAHSFRKLERSTVDGMMPDRAEILAHIEDQYALTALEPRVV